MADADTSIMELKVLELICLLQKNSDAIRSLERLSDRHLLWNEIRENSEKILHEIYIFNPYNQMNSRILR